MPKNRSGAIDFAQQEVTIGDFSVMDQNKQMEMIAALDAPADEMSTDNALIANAIHEKRAADFEDKIGVLVVEMVKDNED